MKLNQKGFSLLEILAVLVLTTVIIVPLLSSFNDSYKINYRAQQRRVATNIASSTIYGFEKIDFSEFRTKLNTAFDNSDYYVEVNADTCLDYTAKGQAICEKLFSTEWNNIRYNSASYKVYLFNYNLTLAEFNDITDSNNLDIKSEVQDIIANDAQIVANIDTANITTLIRVIVWIDYLDNPDAIITIPGMIVDE